MFQHLRIGCILLATLVLVVVPTQPARSDKVTASLTQASKLNEQGLHVKAIEVINATLKSGQISSDLAAKALLLRADAQEKLGKYAYALADYNQALWMEGLSSRDKTQAESGRKRILSKLGVKNEPNKTASESAGESSRTPPKPPSSPSGSAATQDAKVQTSPSEERTGGIGSILEGFFGSSEVKPVPVEEKKPAPKPARTAAVKSSPSQQPTDGGGSILGGLFDISDEAAPTHRASNPGAIQAGKVAAASERPVTPVETARASDQSDAGSSAASAAQLSGDFAIQFTALHSEDSALSEIDRIGKRYGDWLGGRPLSIKIRPTSEGGTLYKVIAEPFERGEGVATCEVLKTKGQSCMLISR